MMCWMRQVNTQEKMKRIVGGCAWLLSVWAVSGCSNPPGASDAINPFRDLPDVPIDGEAHDLTTTIAPLGPLEEGYVVNILVAGEAIEEVLILAEDETFAEAGVIVGGGRAGAAFDFRVPSDGRFFVFVLIAPDATESQRRGTITLNSGSRTSRPPKTQAVILRFEEGFLSDPGLFDPEDREDEEGADQEQAFLEEISDQVREGIVARVRTIFEGTPIEIFDENDGTPPEPFSQVTFTPAREVVDEHTFAIDAVETLGVNSEACPDRVIFGEVLPRGSSQDAGNHDLDDEAVVYVGSFQGRGEPCRTAAVNSVNNIVLGLAQTAAHEIGHLIGLHHVALVDIMDRSPTRAFQRELVFARGQILTESPVTEPDGSTGVATVVLTTVIQDPATYFDSIFGD